ncbi:hypothetical protein [Streptomyces sp. HUAS ZL42]|uniref:hypothetical protein n=1 Tax=Streptomyces sp. HUAS ZL42 TaxID=3231715 RepID=UPI00345E6EAD
MTHVKPLSQTASTVIGVNGLPSWEGCTFGTADGHHQQYLDRNINGHGGIGVSRPIGVAPAKGEFRHRP